MAADPFAVFRFGDVFAFARQLDARHLISSPIADSVMFPAFPIRLKAWHLHYSPFSFSMSVFGLVFGASFLFRRSVLPRQEGSGRATN